MPTCFNCIEKLRAGIVFNSTISLQSDHTEKSYLTNLMLINIWLMFVNFANTKLHLDFKGSLIHLHSAKKVK